MADDTNCYKITSDSPADSSDNTNGNPQDEANTAAPDGARQPVDKVREIGGRSGPDPTRYGDWEKNGRCIDF